MGPGKHFFPGTLFVTLYATVSASISVLIWGLRFGLLDLLFRARGSSAVWNVRSSLGLARPSRRRLSMEVNVPSPTQGCGERVKRHTHPLLPSRLSTQNPLHPEGKVE